MISEVNGPHDKLILDFIGESPKRAMTTPETKRKDQSFIRKISVRISDRKIILAMNIGDFIMRLHKFFSGSN